ncbi:MAG: carbon-nitrogen hydrolase, partial [Cyclobacteriaceae bacterium]
AEATPNSEMTLIVDVDLDLLKDLHYNGSVRTLTDRRTDLYKLERISNASESNGQEIKPEPVKSNISPG